MPGCPNVSERHSVLALLFYFAERIPSRRHCVLPFSFISLGARFSSQKIVTYLNSSAPGISHVDARAMKARLAGVGQDADRVTALGETKLLKKTMRQSNSGTQSESVCAMVVRDHE